ncbi:MAG: hypothetical protein KC431_27560 [Myxococcales bacterium]|nr:hypothetical protein [Myxococcales bacterium]
MAAFLSEHGKQALRGAIEAVEGRSSAELVIVVRAASGSYLHADLIAGILGGMLTLAALLYMPVDFGLHSFLIDPPLLGLVFALFSWRLPVLRRLLTPRGQRDQRVLRGAQAAFFSKGVRRTSGATGILVYISQLERRAEVVADHGVLAAVDGGSWKAAVAAIDARVAAGADAAAVAEAIIGLAEVLEPVLPRSEDDVNELADEVEG